MTFTIMDVELILITFQDSLKNFLFFYKCEFNLIVQGPNSHESQVRTILYHINLGLKNDN